MLLVQLFVQVWSPWDCTAYLMALWYSELTIDSSFLVLVCLFYEFICYCLYGWKFLMFSLFCRNAIQSFQTPDGYIVILSWGQSLPILLSLYLPSFSFSLSSSPSTLLLNCLLFTLWLLLLLPCPWRDVAPINFLSAKQMVADSNHGERQVFRDTSSSYYVSSLLSVTFHPVLSFEVDRKIYRKMLVCFPSVEIIIPNVV